MKQLFYTFKKSPSSVFDKFGSGSVAFALKDFIYFIRKGFGEGYSNISFLLCHTRIRIIYIIKSFRLCMTYGAITDNFK